MIDIEVCKKILNPQEIDPPIREGDNLSWEDLVEISKLVTKPALIYKLFPPSPKGYNCATFLTSVLCCNCGKMVLTKISKTKIHEIIQGLMESGKSNQSCSACFKQQREQQKKDSEACLKRQEIDYRQTLINNTREFIDVFLTPGRQPDEDMAGKRIFPIMERSVSLSHSATITSIILKMPYKDFLNTLYWKSIATHIKRKSKQACSLCSSKNNLHAHHKNYQFHGLEHTPLGLESLVCLCEICHKRHHGKTPEPVA